MSSSSVLNLNFTGEIMSSNPEYKELPSHNFRTEIPNLILDMGLTPYELSVYCMMKRIAGDFKSCWLSNKKMAERCNMSERKFIYIKKQLEEKGLIKITKRFKVDGSHDSDLIEITDLWIENHKHFKEKFSHAQNATGVVHKKQEGGARDADKEEPIKKNHIKEKESKPKKTQKPEKKVPASKDASKLAAPPDPKKAIKREKNVSTTGEEHIKLIEMLGEEETSACYKHLDEWKEDTPKYKWKKNDYRSIRRWVIKAREENKEKAKPKAKPPRHFDFAHKVKAHLKNTTMRIFPSGVSDSSGTPWLELSFNMPYGDFCRLLAKHYEIKNYEGDM